MVGFTGRKWVRIPVAALVVLVLGALCIRYTVVASAADAESGLASRIWPRNPDVLRAEIMADVARAAVEGRPVSATAARKLRLLSREEPLAPVPFSVNGAMALQRGNVAGAEQLLLEARRRDPRDFGVNFLLAQVYLQQAKVAAGLQELLTLANLSPGVVSPVTDMLAGYARLPGALPQLRRVLRSSPDMKSALLAKLARDPQNADLILGLAAPVYPSKALDGWQKGLLASLVNAGEFTKAFGLWHNFSGRSESDLGDFSDSEVSSPFTWTLLTSSEGYATATKRRLDLEFSERSDAPLASRVILLAPGQYELAFRITSAQTELSSVHWQIYCLPGRRKLLDQPLANATSIQSFPFDVPAACSAQNITLQGLAAIYPSEITFSIADLEVRKR